MPERKRFFFNWGLPLDPTKLNGLLLLTINGVLINQSLVKICLNLSCLFHSDITHTKTPLWLVQLIGDNRLRTSLRIIRMDRPLANDHEDVPASCKWSSGWIGLLQMIIRMDWPLANDHQVGLAFCKWSSGWSSLFQKIIRMDRPLANNYHDRHAPCKWSSRWTGLSQMIISMDRVSQMIIWNDWPLANDHPHGSVHCKWSTG